MINVLFFGPVADRMQMRETKVVFNQGMTLQHVITLLSAQNPAAFSIVSFIAVNREQVHDKRRVLCDNDEVAFMAMFSGG